MNERRQPSWKLICRKLLTILFVVILLGGIALAVIYQLDPWLAAERMRALDPKLNEIPVALPDTSVAVLRGESLEHFGVSFQSPWKHAEVSVRHNLILASGNGGTIVFEDPSSNPGILPIVRSLAKSMPDLSPEMTSSICGLQRLAMDAKTDDVKWWRTPRQNGQSLSLLLAKVLLSPMPKGNSYAINVNGLCGFQRGDPAIAPYQVWVKLFDTTDRYYQFMFISHGQSPGFRQNEINAVIASIRFGSTTESPNKYR